ncbi:Cyclic nucleotide-gated ion channel 1 [Ancistrocladus abbreviatus]
MSRSVQLAEAMNRKREKCVRFEDKKLEKSSVSGQEFSSSDALGTRESRTTLGRTTGVIYRGFERGSKGIRTLRESFGFPLPHDESVKKSVHQKGNHQAVLDPQGQFLQKWNKIFLISCVLSVALDPLFFYIPVFDGKRKCLRLDHTLEIIACVLRTLTDMFYLVHIIFQFRTGFISPSSRVLGRGELIKDRFSIAIRYLSSSFVVDVLAVLPLPQVAVLFIIPRLPSPAELRAKDLLKSLILSQYVPRILRIYPRYKEVTRTSGIITETAWAGAAFNLILYMLASHVVGSFWYLFAIERADACRRKACKTHGCNLGSLYCGKESGGDHRLIDGYCQPVGPDDIQNTNSNFGMFSDALLYVVESRNFPQKLIYCCWWGLRNLSSLGQNLKTSTSVGENLFAGFICVFGLVLFTSLIGNMQKYLQSTTVRVEEMRVKRRDAEQWMSHRLLPENLRERIRRYEQYKWQETRGVDEDSLIRTLPKDLRRDIKRHLCLALLMRVPMFKTLDEQVIDAMCDRLKPVLYTESSFIVREGDPVDEMLFIMRGCLLTMTTNGGRTGFFNSVYLKAGDFCGEELLTWALDPHSSSNLPISTRTVQSITDVEAFALMGDDLKFVASQFRRLHSRQLRHTFRFYSQQWRTWAACFIQVAWRQYYKRKLYKSLQEAEERLQDALTNEVGSSPSLGATIYASRFAANALRNLRENAPRNTRMSTRLPPILSLQKPAEPDFGSEDVTKAR